MAYDWRQDAGIIQDSEHSTSLSKYTASGLQGPSNPTSYYRYNAKELQLLFGSPGLIPAHCSCLFKSHHTLSKIIKLSLKPVVHGQSCGCSCFFCWETED